MQNMNVLEILLQSKECSLRKALFSKDPALLCLVINSGPAIVGYASYTIDFSTGESAYFFIWIASTLNPVIAVKVLVKS